MNFLWLSLKLERNSGWCGQRVWHNTVPPYHYSYSHRHYSHQAASGFRASLVLAPVFCAQLQVIRRSNTIVTVSVCTV